MTSTRIAGNEQPATSTWAWPHTDRFEPGELWHLPAIPAAGGFSSTAADMMRLADALRDTTKGPLAKVMAFAIRPRRRYASDSIGLGWHHLHVDGVDITWHNGGTGGSRSWLGADVAHHRAVVVLSNAITVAPDPIGLDVLRGIVPKDPPVVTAAAEIELPADALRRFVGRYQLAPGVEATISQTTEGLWVQLTGQPRFRIYAQGPASFFLRAVAARLDFETDASGVVVAVTLTQNGTSQRAPRIKP
jgi:CubicO group peptidase (beta-lactamase class C family)